MLFGSKNKKTDAVAGQGFKKCLGIAFRLGLCPAMTMVLMLPAMLHAQIGQGGIGGTVHDAHGAVIPHASIDVTSNATGVQQTTRSNDEGTFQVLSLNPGEYTIGVSSPGFEQTRMNSVTVAGVGLTTLDVTLDVGRANTVVTVNASVDLLSKSESDVTTTVDHKLVLDLPYPERS
jgi:hypothetical protein